MNKYEFNKYALFMLQTYSEVVGLQIGLRDQEDVIEREMEEAQKVRSKNSRFRGSQKWERDFKRHKVTHPQQQPRKQEWYSGTTDWAKGPRRCYECGEVGHLGGIAQNFNDLHTSHLNNDSFSR